jgi:nicotinamidase-related amidase
MPATRVIIDMQAAFAASSNPNCVIAVAREMIQAMREKAPILIVEYKGSGPTHQGFLDLVKDYPYAARIRKESDGGAREVIRAMKRRGFNTKYLRICGVNTDCCVEETVRGLAQNPLLEKSKIELVKSACNTTSNKYDWRRFVQRPNISLV